MDEVNSHVLYLPPDNVTNFWFYAVLAAMIIFSYFVVRGIREIYFETITPNLCRVHQSHKPTSYGSDENGTRTGPHS
ncbi:unnamed protein product [Schistosoma guineensis]|uniref:Uncharacterized protein n=1 Tax=Schistosoma margrebowiei TaxID=48269 RepID=A0AA84ZNA2_9TREM|nr:unnamed protein product [Schistosoma guineensis]CAH8470297.1 unnamed protein product [Schistosoma margrebowiei]CAH8470363.1 unnamed protein product [Schistosoma curassoni]CAH8472952.1 unnamed protein product [Schistosoma haematobium]